MELDNAPLPPPVKRGRKPKVDSVSALQGWQAAIQATTAAALSQGTGAVRIDYDEDSNSIAVERVETGWTTGVATTRFPPEGQDMLIGGYFNGQYRSMAEYSDERYACIGVEDDLRVEWYERCDNPGAWVWVASVYPNGIELRRTN